MATRIAIISRTRDQVTAAFYYDVKTKAVPKPGFVSAAFSLDPSVSSALSAGAVIECVRDFSFSGWPLDQIQAHLQKEWEIGQEKALADSAADAEGVGMFFDGNAWA